VKSQKSAKVMLDRLCSPADSRHESRERHCTGAGQLDGVDAGRARDRAGCPSGKATAMSKKATKDPIAALRLPPHAGSAPLVARRIFQRWNGIYVPSRIGRLLQRQVGRMLVH
jgi:hypothetical protein